MMQNYAEILNGTVFALGTCEDGHDLTCAPPLQRVVCSSEVQPSWTYDGTTFAPPVTVPPTPAEINATLQAQMDRLDGGGQARQIREAFLATNPPQTQGLARLQALDAELTALRAQLVH
jgi:hypothetical protein